MKAQSNKGFKTVVPIILILGLVITLSGILVPAFERSAPLRGEGLAVERLREVSRAFEAYRSDMGRWPFPGLLNGPPSAVRCAFLGAYTCLCESPVHSLNWRGPYVDRFLPSENGLYLEESMRDPWGGGYQVFHFPPHSVMGAAEERIALLSPGPNGTVDTPMEGLAFGYAAGDDLVVVVRDPK